MKRQPASDLARYAYGFSDDRAAAIRDLRFRLIMLAVMLVFILGSLV